MNHVLADLVSSAFDVPSWLLAPSDASPAGPASDILVRYTHARASERAAIEAWRLDLGTL